MVMIMNGDRRPFMGSMLMSTAIPSPLIYWKRVTTSARFKNYLAIEMSAPRWFTLTSSIVAGAALPVRPIAS